MPTPRLPARKHVLKARFFSIKPFVNMEGRRAVTFDHIEGSNHRYIIGYVLPGVVIDLISVTKGTPVELTVLTRASSRGEYSNHYDVVDIRIIHEKTQVK